MSGPPIAKRAKKKRRGDANRGAANQNAAAESRGAEALTVLWMLTALATLIAETVAAGAALLAIGYSVDKGASLLSVLPGAMLFTALVTGIICLLVTPLVLRLRRTSPPRGVIAVAVLLGASPWALLAVWLIRN